jgi:hypothetical protein
MKKLIQLFKLNNSLYIDPDRSKKVIKKVVGSASLINSEQCDFDDLCSDDSEDAPIRPFESFLFLCKVLKKNVFFFLKLN